MLAISLHEMAVANEDRLTGQSIARETHEEEGGRGNILRGSELTIHGFPQHNIFDHVLFGNSKLLGLLRDLFLNQRCTNEAGTNHIGPYSVFGSLLRHRLGQANDAMFCGDVRRLVR